MKRFFRNIILLFNFIAALTLFVIYLSVHISPETFWLPAVIGLTYPYVFLVNVLFIIYWLFSSPKWSLLSILTILIGFNHSQNYFQFSDRETEKKGIVVCSYNVKAFNNQGYDKLIETGQSIFDYLKTKEADIICIQEMNMFNRKEWPFVPKKFNVEGLPKYVFFNHNYGPITMSRFPIVHTDEIIFENTGNMVLITDLATSTDTIRVFNCHLESYRFSPDEINSLDSISFSQKEKSLREVRLFGSKLKHAFIKRTAQVEELRRQVDQSPYPVLICGDFNDTPVSYTYNTVRADLKDAFVESGAGIGNTYLGKLPSFRIDYILHSASYKAYNFKVDHVDFSDHYPINCTLLRE